MEKKAFSEASSKGFEWGFCPYGGSRGQRERDLELLSFRYTHDEKQEHTLFNDLRRKLAKRSKELVNFNDFFCSLQKRTIKNLALVVSLSISVIWCDPPRETQNTKSTMISERGVTPLSLSLLYTEGGSHPKMKLGGETRQLGL